MVMRPMMGSLIQRLLTLLRRERPTIVPASYRTLSTAPAPCQGVASWRVRLNAYAGGKVPGLDGVKRRHPRFALLDGDGTARVEDAARGRAERARHLAPQHRALPRQLHRGIGNGHGGEQRLRVRMLGILVERLAIGDLHDLPEVHHGHSVR